MEASINDHARVMVELTERFTVAEERQVIEERTRASFDEIHRNFIAMEANNRASFDEIRKSFVDIKLMIVSTVA